MKRPDHLVRGVGQTEEGKTHQRWLAWLKTSSPIRREILKQSRRLLLIGLIAPILFLKSDCEGFVNFLKRLVDIPTKGCS